MGEGRRGPARGARPGPGGWGSQRLSCNPRPILGSGRSSRGWASPESGPAAVRRGGGCCSGPSRAAVPERRRLGWAGPGASAALWSDGPTPEIGLFAAVGPLRGGGGGGWRQRGVGERAGGESLVRRCWAGEGEEAAGLTARVSWVGLPSRRSWGRRAARLTPLLPALSAALRYLSLPPIFLFGLFASSSLWLERSGKCGPRGQHEVCSLCVISAYPGSDVIPLLTSSTE